MIPVYVFGSTGRMGQLVCENVSFNKDLELVGGFSRRQKENAPQKSPEIVIDFSLPAALDDLILFTKEHKSCIVSGTTGYTEEQFEKLKSLANDVPIFWSANMSFGVFLMCQLVEKLAAFEAFYSFQIEETHHKHKVDKPSGTALIIEKAARQNTAKIKPTLSHREGEVFGIHHFSAQSKLEKLTITHEALDRSLFAQGAIKISLWLKNQKPGFYQMTDFFEQFSN